MEKLHEYLPGDSRERIQDLLIERKMTQAQLAEKLEISESSLNRYLSGQTDKLSTENIVKMARIFGVSTDFLLCETDIPYRTNYDIEELGLSAKAAARLYTGEVDPVIASQLLEHEEFAILAAQIAQFKDVTISAGIAGMNAMIDQLGSLIQQVGNKNPQLQRAAIRARQDIESVKRQDNLPDTSAMEDTFLRIVKDLRSGADAYIAEADKLTTEVMMQLMKKLTKRGGKNLMKVTPEQIVEAILDTTDPRVFTEEHRKAMRTVLLPLFKRTRK